MAMTKAGALWKRKSNKGTTFLSGNVEIEGRQHPILVFKNDEVDEERKQPHYRIMLSDEEPRRAKKQEYEEAPF